MTQTATIPAQEKTRYLCERAKSRDVDAIGKLLKQAMPGKVSFAMTHGHDHHAAVNLASERVSEVVVRDRSKQAPSVVGYGYRAVRPVYINGRIATAGYLGGLRCDRSLRAAFRVLAAAFDTLAADREPDEPLYDLTSIMADNTVVRRGLEKGLPGLPTYVPIGEILTLTIQAARHGRLDKRIRKATHRDASNIQALLDETSRQYHGRQAWQIVPPSDTAPGDGPTRDDFLIFDDEHGPKGCIAQWDQRSLKQIVVADLHPTLRRLRYAMNLAAYVTGRPLLPGPGEQLNMAFASHAAFQLDTPQAAEALIAGACAIASHRGIKLVSIGLPAEAPIAPRLIHRFKPWVSRSVIYAVTHHPQTLDLDNRPVWMEIATL
jgi:hypothetical protein